MKVWIRYLLLLSALLSLSEVKGQTFRGGEIFQMGNSDLYWAAVKTQFFKDFVASQEEDMWCWAACTQMVLNYQGVNVSQEDVVRRVHGYRVNKPGTAYDIQQAANGWRTGQHTIVARVDTPYGASATTFINDLVNKYPLVVGLSMPGQNVGHAYVLTGISFRVIGGQYYPQEVILRDPWPTSPSRNKISWSDFISRVHTIVHIYPQ